MRKKIFAALVVAAGVAFAGYNTIKSQNEGKALSDLIGANVEALASGETDSGGNTFYCCGNTGTCAKGTDAETGEEFIIHGTLQSSPCK